MKTDDPAFQRGVALREEIFGAAGLKSIENADDFQAPLQDMVTRVCFGEVWDRPAIDLKTRSLITIGILAGQGRAGPFKNHVRGAIGNGATKEEVREVLLHALIYVGFAHATESWAWATEALKEVGAY